MRHHDAPRHDDPRQRGFTLIELLMVVSIIGILMAIAIPTFIGTRKGASDRSAQTLVRNLLVSAHSAGTGAPPDPAQIQQDEPSLHVVAANAEALASRSEVSVKVDQSAGAGFVLLASRSTSGTCFAVLEPQGGATRYQRAELASCTAEAFDPSVGWSDQWR